jgi:Na+-driven multidrug efflux pump
MTFVGVLFSETFLRLMGTPEAVLHMNVAGAALATTISQGFSAVMVVRVLMKRTDACRLEPKKLCFHSIQPEKMMTIGLPAGLQSCLFSIQKNKVNRKKAPEHQAQGSNHFGSAV